MICVFCGKDMAEPGAVPGWRCLGCGSLGDEKRGFGLPYFRYVMRKGTFKAWETWRAPWGVLFVPPGEAFVGDSDPAGKEESG